MIFKSICKNYKINHFSQQHFKSFFMFNILSSIWFRLVLFIKKYFFYHKKSEMHFTIIWQISNSPNDYGAMIRSYLNGFTFIEPIPQYFIVRVNNMLEYQNILTNIRSRLIPVIGLRIIFSPLMVSGKYDGLLPTGLWPTINNITN
jgi:hypothetical protein